MIRRRVKKKPMAEINVVPYIDVMLVLLIVFMVTAPLLMQGVKVDLPDAPSAPMDNQDDEPLIVSVKVDGSYYLNIGGNEKMLNPCPKLQQPLLKYCVPNLKLPYSFGVTAKLITVL